MRVPPDPSDQAAIRSSRQAGRTGTADIFILLRKASEMNVKTLILAILNTQDASGYEIKKLSSEGRFSYFVDISFGSIYPTLARLETEGMVTCRTETQTGKPDRKIYSIAPAGRVALALGLAQPPRRDKFKSEFLLVAINAQLAGTEAIKRAISERIDWLQAEVEMLGNVAKDCDNPATSWVANYGRAVMGHDLDYLKSNKDALIALSAKPLHLEAAE